MFQIFYTLGLFVYLLLIRVFALKSQKAKLWIKGRKEWRHRLKTALEDNTFPVAWFHCSSLGEFEQARPVIEAFRKNFSAYKILLTFFSPSGLEVRKNYKGADFIFYLPLDTRKNAQDFLDITQPKLIIFTKYDFWYNFLDQIRHREIPCLLISAIFRQGHFLFQWYGSPFKKVLYAFDSIFVQDNFSKELLFLKGFENVVMSGDTRFDRVFQVAAGDISHPMIERFQQGSQVLVAGSTWPEDINRLLPILLSLPLKIIIAPHEINESVLRDIEQKAQGQTARYSRMNENSINVAKVLIIDNIGMLSQLYRYGMMAYIGGGFGKGIHNTLEAAAFGLPVLFGPNFEKFKEAKDLLHLGCAMTINTPEETRSIVEALLNNQSHLKILQQRLLKYITENKGASDKIIDYCKIIIKQ